MKNTETKKRIQWLEFHGQRVLFLDFSHSSTEESLKLINEFTKAVQTEPDSSVVMLTDVTGAEYNSSIASKWKAARLEQDSKILLSAVYGLSGLVGVAVRAFQQVVEMLGKRRVKVCASQEEAVRYLSNPENRP